MANQVSRQRLAISKATAQVVAIVGIASFVTVFSLIGSHALLTQNIYLNRVTKAKNIANQQLKTNLSAVTSLTSSYQSFVGKPTNVIGGASTGTGPNVGDNATIILDALPSSYDFPALTDRNLKISSISGTDDQVV